MSISQISPNSLAAPPQYTNPLGKLSEQQPNVTLQNNQDAQKPVKSTQTDTVTISQQALQMTSGANTPAGNTKNSTGTQTGSSFSTQG